MRKVFSVAVGIFATFGLLAANAQTIFKYGNHQVSKEEFLRIYEKNNAQKKPDYSLSSINEYLNLYALFRMKVQEAEEMRLDTSASVQNELNNYKNQLAKSYLIDKEVTNDLVKEAYDRLKSEIKVAHILIAVRPNEDSARAKAQADSIYQVLIAKKANFLDLAKSFSDDKSTADKGGEIGYITALQVLYPFETVAYQTPVGQIAKPFRTQFGYHILKIEDKRLSRGKVQVAQIMIGTPKSSGEQGIKEAKEKAQQVLKDLKSGKSFEELVTQYSDDKFTNKNKGIMEPFTVGTITPVFEDAAFSLKKPGDISAPFQTEFGIHILKLIKKEEPQSFDEAREDLTRKVENDSRSTIAKEAYMEGIKKKLNFKEYPDNLNEFLSAFAHDTARVIKKETYQSFQKPLFEMNKKSYKQNDFLDFVFKLTNGNLYGNKIKSLTDLYKVYQTNSIQEVQQNQLEKENEEFRGLVNEYKNGIMLFDLMDKKVWTRASTDSLGLEKFYENHKNKYLWLPGFEGTVFTSTNENEIKQLKSYIDKDGMTPTEALDKISENKVNINTSSQTGRYEFSKFPLSAQDYQAGHTTKMFQYEDHSYSFIAVVNVEPEARQKTLSEAKGFVVADYQDYLEKEWNNQLKAKYPLVIYEKVVESIVR